MQIVITLRAAETVPHVARRLALTPGVDRCQALSDEVRSMLLDVARSVEHQTKFSRQG